jgi:hypothetical protein
MFGKNNILVPNEITKIVPRPLPWDACSCEVQSAAVHTEKLILFYHHCTIIKKKVVAWLPTEVAVHLVDGVLR